MAKRESVVENYLRLAIKKAGGACEKHKCVGTRGDPDRIVAYRTYTCFVETKWEEGIEPEPHQLRRHKFWREHGVPVHVVRSKHEADKFLRFLGIRNS